MKPQPMQDNSWLDGHRNPQREAPRMRKPAQSGSRLISVLAFSLICLMLLPGTASAASLPPGGTFTDDDGLYHERYIEALVEAELSDGCGGGRYCPDRPVTRAELATLLVRGFFGTANLPPYQGRFPDVAPSAWYAGYVEGAFQLGIIEGYGDSTFRPGSPVSRSEAAALIMRALGSEPGAPVAGHFDDVSPRAWYAPAVERIYDMGITKGCFSNPLRFCPDGAVTRGEAATLLSRALKLEPIVPKPRPQPMSGVAVRPGESIQAAVDSHPAGTTFVIKSGVHKRQSVIPKGGNTFVGESGAVMSGENVTSYAFGAQVNNVTIKNLVIEKYAGPKSEAAIFSLGGASGWRIEGNEIRYNNGSAVRSGGTGWHIVGNYLHHNEVYGLTGTGVGMVIEDNEIAFNNYQRTSGGDAGGSKWFYTQDLVVRNNYSHDNGGPGLWTDGHNQGVLYEGNRVVNNTESGIKHEASCDAVIRNNTVEGNGFASGEWMAGGIRVSLSPNVEVHHNVVTNNRNGITAVYCTPLLCQHVVSRTGWAASAQEPLGSRQHHHHGNRTNRSRSKRGSRQSVRRMEQPLRPQHLHHFQHRHPLQLARRQDHHRMESNRTRPQQHLEVRPWWASGMAIDGMLA